LRRLINPSSEVHQQSKDLKNDETLHRFKVSVQCILGVAIATALVNQYRHWISIYIIHRQHLYILWPHIMGRHLASLWAKYWIYSVYRLYSPDSTVGKNSQKENCLAHQLWRGETLAHYCLYTK